MGIGIITISLAVLIAMGILNFTGGLLGQLFLGRPVTAHEIITKAIAGVIVIGGYGLIVLAAHSYLRVPLWMGGILPALVIFGWFCTWRDSRRARLEERKVERAKLQLLLMQQRMEDHQREAAKLRSVKNA